MGARSVVSVCFVFILLQLSDAGLVKKLIRHRRETLAPLSNTQANVNGTLPNVNKPVVFNHVYRINIPAGALCSVDLEAPSGSELQPPATETTEHTLDGENQIVFTHRITIPRQACACSDSLPDLKELLNRLEVLEGEVSTLRDQCSSATGCCGAHVTGELGTRPYCNGHGNYSFDTCSCICEPGWKGTKCSVPACPNDCHDQGQCVNGMCVCFDGFAGVDCSVETCHVDCGENGQCIDGVCVCTDGYAGQDCSQPACPNNCLGRGNCEDGRCICKEPWTGFDCSELICPDDCYDRGRCINGTCYCDQGFTGEDCREHACPGNCHGRGICVDGQCICSTGYTGDDCSILTCPNNCNERGRCSNGMCICDPGYQGEDCGQLACPNNCNNRGRCFNGQCICNAGFQGEDCSELSCPNNCLNRGHCANGQCVCQEGFAGEDCSIQLCPNNCYGQGECIHGSCVCYAGFTGQDCSELTCPNDCHNNGRCVYGQCVCNEGFTGNDCGEKACPNFCNSRGKCVKGICICQEKYSGEDCSELACPKNCNNRGRCVSGTCICDEGFVGEDCIQLGCPSDCSGQGSCKAGQCICDKGFVGEDCSQVSPPKDLTVVTVNPETMNLTWTNDKTVTDYYITYTPTSPGGLQMDFRVPGDRRSTIINELEPGIEYLIMVYAILDGKESVPVSARVATHLPTPEGLKFRSVKDTSVEVLWDPLDIPFDGWILTFRNTKEENGQINNIIPHDKTWFEQTGLGPGQEYEVKVEVLKNDTHGPPVIGIIRTKIDAPRQVEVRDVTDSSAMVTWFSPEASVDGVIISYGPSNNPSDQQSVNLPPTDTQYHITDLKPNTEYRISMTSKRGGTASDPAVGTFTTDLDTPKDLKKVGQTDRSITLEWTNSKADVDKYRVKYGPISGGPHTEMLLPSGPGKTTTGTITGLRPGMEYSISVTGVKRDRESSPTTISAATDLDAPRDLGLSDSSATSVTLSWRRPRAKIDHYRLNYVLTNGQQEEVLVPADATSYTLNSLNPGMQYIITLVAERGRQRSSPATISASTENETEPQVMNLTVSDVTWGSFRLSWSAMGTGAFDGFFIEVADSEGATEGQNHTLPDDAWSLGITHLSPNTSYRISLRGLYQGSLLEATLAEATTVPEPTVGTLRVSNVTSESFTISWNTTEGDFEGYALEVIDSNWLLEPMEYNLSYNVLSHDITGLSPSTDYIAYLYGVVKGVRTQAVSTVATTGIAASFLFTVFMYFHLKLTISPPKSAEPDLAKLVVSNITSDRLSLSWKTGAKAFQNFVVEIRESARPLRAMGRTLSGAARSTVISGLRGDTRYSIKLYGSTGRQNTPPLTAVATTEPDPQLGSLTVSEISPDNFTLSWSTVAGHFDGFVVRVSDSNQMYDTLELQLPGDARNSTATGLVDATAYDIELYGISHGRRTPSLSAHASTVELPKVENLNISEISPFGFRVSWMAQDGDQLDEFDHFHLVVTDSGWLLDPQEFMVPGNQTSLDIRGLITGIGYDVRLTGVTRSGLQSRPLTTVAVTEAEPEVDHLFISDITSESFRLAWTAEDDVFDRFLIKIRDSKKAAHPKELSVSGAARTKVIKGLSGGTEYEIELYGMTLERRSQPVMGVARTALGSPRGLRFFDVTDSSATVAWNKPRTPVDSYRVTYVPLGGGNPMTVTADRTETRVVLRKLTPGVTYQVSVVTVKGLEESDPASEIVTTALDKPRGVTAINVTDSKALLLWQPTVANVDGYIITYSSDSASPYMEQVSGNTVEFQMTGLTPATKYLVNVRSVKGGHNSDATNTEFTTDVDAPHDLKVANVQAESAVVTWTPPLSHVEGYILKYGTPGGTMRVRSLAVLPALFSTWSPVAVFSFFSSCSPPATLLLILMLPLKVIHPLSACTCVHAGDMLYTLPKDCSQTFLNGDTTSGQYTVYMGGRENQPAQVFCDMATDGGGWIVFLRRQNGKVNFFRNWKNYTIGFGDPDGEFWLGLEKLHKITSSGQYELRVDLRDQGESVYALYDNFSVLDARSRYKVHVGKYSGTAGDSMTYHHGRPFSTYDKDNDIAVTNCALSYQGAFWYENCHRVNLMGRYGDNSHSKGVNWYHWKGHEHSIEFAEMKIRPFNFRNFEGRRKRS
ncbi:tenascin-like isoform X1 [Arapaima gigas]